MAGPDDTEGAGFLRRIIDTAPAGPYEQAPAPSSVFMSPAPAAAPSSLPVVPSSPPGGGPWWIIAAAAVVALLAFRR